MPIDYKASGVDVDAANKEVDLLKDIVKKTYIKGVLSELGGFSGLFEIDTNEYKNPVLVSGTDGVGTKLKLAFMMDKHDTVGIDCVAMCVNDVLCQGAKPLFFLDYIATGKLIPEKMAQIVSGVAKGCLDSGCAIIGGETAEMPGFYTDGEYDIAGFCVGVVDKQKIVTGENIKPNDLILGLPSSGVHSNGFSLVRKLFFEDNNFKID
ncbi:phosphoribosylformylglycinamidine cyclo-ligase, partial [Vibrio parahaemolyticus]|nr:phosphoribosylformylglycinamidine cyclo-ligase [Vibrio parahaemolyticus]